MGMERYRIKNIQHDVDAMFSILPFEVEFYQRYHFPVHYVGNPCVDAVDTFRKNFNENIRNFRLCT